MFSKRRYSFSEPSIVWSSGMGGLKEGIGSSARRARHIEVWRSAVSAHSPRVDQDQEKVLVARTMRTDAFQQERVHPRGLVWLCLTCLLPF